MRVAVVMMMMVVVMVMGLASGDLLVRTWAFPKREALSSKEENGVLKNCLDTCKDLDSVHGSCSAGCKGQVRALEDMKSEHPGTKYSYLLGSSVERCWKGCKDPEEQICKDACTRMRKLQKEYYEEIEERKEESSEEDSKSKEDAKEDSKIEVDEYPKDGRLQPALTADGWNVYVVDDSSSIQRQLNYMNAVSRQMLTWVLGSWMEDMEEMDEQMKRMEEQTPRRMYVGPPRSRKPDSSSQPSLYDKASAAMYDLKDSAVSAFTDFKSEVNSALRSDSLSQKVMWVLVVTSVILILASFVSWIYDAFFGKDTEDDGDYYKLPVKTGLPSSTTVLPTYAECVKNDKATLRDIKELEEYFKVDLSFPTPMVVNISEKKVPLEERDDLVVNISEEKVPLEKKEEMEKKDEI